jgi:hypothetical protein
MNRRGGCADVAWWPANSASASRHTLAEDDLLAFLLIHTWTLTTGRILRSDVPPEQLSEYELIEFWSDERTASGDTAHPHRFARRVAYR